MTTTTTAKPLKTFSLSCVCCGASDAITIDLNDLGGAITCQGCGEEFTAKEARAKVAAQLKRWTAAVAWLESAGEFTAE